jgi:hypothetical protein
MMQSRQSNFYPTIGIRYNTCIAAVDKNAGQKVIGVITNSKRLYFTGNCAFIVHTNVLVKCDVHVLCTSHLKIIAMQFL